MVKENESSRFFTTLNPYPRLIRFFDHGESLVTYGTDAMIVAEIQYQTTTVLKNVNGLSACSLNPLLANELIKRLLVELKYRIEVYAMEEGNWKLSRKASPGNLREVEDLISGLTCSPVVAATWTLAQVRY
jgi:DNA mismatch repair protein MSH2